ncbi:MAG: winged helix-turn-helix transcriptional regulator [Candidatus Eremiobacteraeota bacterium]|nr:winged helix-turn-helix transcriptional regulator [Candidatus Eremiobacteraeota bacterium]MCW5870381.1 winged helix-turn-helix transcriptional regulator [Candidatus Eremiobacteraeota bacterium]
MQAFAALADPTRRRIVEILSRGSLSAGEIAGRFTITAPAISQHLKALRQARLVRVRPLAQQRIYELDPAGIGELSQWLQSIQAFWAPRLDRLGAALKEPPDHER